MKGLNEKLSKFVVCLLVSTAGASTAAAQGTDAKAYVIHGIPGQDLGLDPELRVDVSVNGACALPGFEFGDIVGPLDFPEGTYDIAIGLADDLNPCSADAVIAASVDLEAGVNYSIIAYLDADGMPTAGLFENDLDSRRGRTKVNVAHTAWAPTVDIKLQRPGKRSRNAVVVPDVSNGDSLAADFRAGPWMVSIAPAGSDTPVFGPVRLFLKPYVTAYLVFAVGSLENETFTLLVKPITNMKSDDDDDSDDDSDDDDDDDSDDD
jgi:hypothetical protein